MADLVYVAVIVGFFVLCVAYVTGLDRLVGPDPEDLPEPPAPGDVGASEHERGGTA